MKPRTWAAVVGGALTIMIGAALVIAEDHEDHFSGDDATTTTVPVVIETTTTTAATTTTAPPAYGVVWHTGYTSVSWDDPTATEEHKRQASVAVANGLLYRTEHGGEIFVYPIDIVDYFYYYSPYPGKEWGSIHLRLLHGNGAGNGASYWVSYHNVSDLAGLVAELEEALGD